MRQALKKELKRAFEAPQPVRKKAFLRTLEQPKTSVFAFVLSQLGYIRRWVWLVSALVFILSMMGAAGLPADTVWIASALMPLLALTVVSESGRSENYEMAELEMATCFSLRSVVLTRLGLLGVENLFILVLLSVGIWRQEKGALHGAGVLTWGACMLLPYLLTTFAGLAVVRRLRGREAVYICAGIAVCISFSVTALHGSVVQYCRAGDGLWRTATMLLLLVLLIGTARQCVGIVRQTEAV